MPENPKKRDVEAGLEEKPDYKISRTVDSTPFGKNGANLGSANEREDVLMKTEVIYLSSDEEGKPDVVAVKISFMRNLDILAVKTMNSKILDRIVHFQEFWIDS